MTVAVPDGLLVDVAQVSQIFERLHAVQHTGCVMMLVHFAQGHVRCVDVPSEMLRIPLDTKRKPRHS